MDEVIELDSQEYFKRAEKANRRYQHAMIALGLFVTIALAVTNIVLLRVNQNNHKTSQQTLNTIVQNEIKLNDNLRNSVKCLFNIPPGTTQQQTIMDADQCFSSANNISDPK